MFIISEIFPQHGGSLHIAEQMILQSKLGGADAVKVQLYTATQFGAERGYLELTYDGLRSLKSYADTLRIPLFATPFNHERLQWCLDLQLPYMKVAARMHEEMPDLVEAIMATGKPTFVSVPDTYDTTRIKRHNNATYLLCSLKYPTRLDELTIPNFKVSMFSGISDHSVGIAAALYAAAHGARVIEKHFTLSHSLQIDTEKAHLGAMTYNELLQIREMSLAFGKIDGV